MMVDDKVITLKERINGCMIRSMNGKELPEDSPEMQAIIAYIKFLGQGYAGGRARRRHGTLSDRRSALWRPMPRAGRRSMPISARVATRMTARASPTSRRALAMLIPPLWGDDSFNAAAGMAKLAHAAAYVRTNMPFGVRYQDPVLTVQQAWDVAAYMISKPRPPAPPGAGVESALAAELAALASVAGLRDCGPAEPIAGNYLAAKLGERGEVQHDR